MKFLSVCSGIEAASVAWKPLGWEAVGFSEIEPFPCAVLAHHYPDVPNHGSLLDWKDWINDVPEFDVLAGGTPCQGFSVAGRRGGLDDPRSQLAFDFLGIARSRQPRWVFWENVPGVLSSDGGRDFGAFLGELGKCGYGFAYRVLDAQYFGLAQRRKRVFVVGYLGDWRPAAAVLLEPESLRGDSPPSREAGEGTADSVAPSLRGSGPGCARTGDSRGQDPVIAFAWQSGLGVSASDLCPTQIRGQHHAVAHSLRAEGHDASEDGTGRGVPLVTGPLTNASGHAAGSATTQDAFSGQLLPVAMNLRGRDGGAMPELDATSNKGMMALGETNASTQEADAGTLLHGVREALGAEAFAEWGLGILDSLQRPEVLRQALHGLSIRQAAFSKSWVVYCTLSRSEDLPAGAMQSLREAKGSGCPPQGWGPPEQLARELGAYLSKLSQPGAQAERLMRDLWQASEGLGILRQALSAVQEIRRPAHVQAQSARSTLAVRRLTVEECEFLQGFPRGYTLVPHRGKPAADGPRYKALGNSWAVPVVRWIGARMNQCPE